MFSSCNCAAEAILHVVHYPRGVFFFNHIWTDLARHTTQLTKDVKDEVDV